MSRSTISGRVERGRGRGAVLLSSSHRVQRLTRVTGLMVVPGTLNLRLSGPLDRRVIQGFLPAGELGEDWEGLTGQSGYHIFHVLVEGRFRGLAFQAEEPGYPEDLVEVLSGVHLRAELGLSDGDEVTLSLLPRPNLR